jgi:RNA polymerase sigma factor (sigma-70 family)
MLNPFYLDQDEDRSDHILVNQALEGDKKALEQLMSKHHLWIYNIAYKMVGHPQDAEDVTQEIMIKILTKLSTFKGQSLFRTWLYRIVKNHVLNMQKRQRENQISSFDRYWKDIDKAPDAEIADVSHLSVDLSLIVKETRVLCIMGMLLCLDRMQRLVFILGDLFEVDENLGSELLEISRVNFRQILSRSRKRLYHFMTDKCSLIREGNPCRCSHKLKSLIDCGAIDPHHLTFTADYLCEFKEISKGKYLALADAFDDHCREKIAELPVHNPPDFTTFFRKILNSSEFKAVIDFKI